MTEQPDQETRGGEVAGDWQVSGSAAANAAAIRAHLMVLEGYLAQWQESHGD